MIIIYLNNKLSLTFNDGAVVEVRSLLRSVIHE